MQSNERGGNQKLSVGMTKIWAGVPSEIHGQNSWWEIWGRTPRKQNTFTAISLVGVAKCHERSECQLVLHLPVCYIQNPLGGVDTMTSDNTPSSDPKPDPL